jgi:hypothetical protein
MRGKQHNSVLGRKKGCYSDMYKNLSFEYYLNKLKYKQGIASNT